MLHGQKYIGSEIYKTGRHSEIHKIIKYIKEVGMGQVHTTLPSSLVDISLWQGKTTGVKILSHLTYFEMSSQYDSQPANMCTCCNILG